MNSASDHPVHPINGAGGNSSSANSRPPVADLPLHAIVLHRHTVSDSTTLEEVHTRFRELDVDFMAVTKNERAVGLVGRNRLGFLMGSRFGFSLYSHSAAGQFMLPNPLIVTEETPVKELLDRAFCRQGDEFYEDALLVDANTHPIGLINVETLARLQTRLVAEQLNKLEQQHTTLRNQNLTLFRTNHALRQSRGLYQGLFESEALGVALLNTDGFVELHNRRFGELVGLSSSHADGVGLTERMMPQDRVEFLQLLKKLEAGITRTDSTREFSISVLGEKRRRFRITTGWIGETGQVSACFDDVTEQRALEQMMMRKEKQNLLDTLVGGIAHELNNKLTPVLAFAELLRNEVDERLAFHTESIRSSATEAAKIIRQLLQFSKPIEGDSAPVDLRAVVENCLPMVKISIQDTCRIKVTQPSEPVTVIGDAGQLKQVMINLVINASHAVADEGDPEIEVIVGGNQERAELTVVDNGRGIAAEDLQRIFDPFFTTKGPDKGSGLGLSICFSIARQHGGEITAQSEPGAGASFTLSLPREETPAALAPEDGGGQAPGLFAPAIAVQRTRVLVVEDENVLRSVLQEMLRAQFGCEVEMAANGREALDALRSREYDLVVSDIRMPEMNGVDLYQALGDVRPDQRQNFVFVTGYAGAAAVPGKPVPSNVPVLAKPFSLRQFEEMCGPYLRKEATA